MPGRGYTLGKLCRVIIGVPDSAEPGSSSSIKIAAEASWLGQSGSAAVTQARGFDSTVSVATESSEYTEVVITEDDTEQGKGSDTWSLKDWLPPIIGVSAIIVAAVVLLLRRRSRS